MNNSQPTLQLSLSFSFQNPPLVVPVAPQPPTAPRRGEYQKQIASSSDTRGQYQKQPNLPDSGARSAAGGKIKFRSLVKKVIKKDDSGENGGGGVVRPTAPTI